MEITNCVIQLPGNAIKQCLDFARHDKGLWFLIEVSTSLDLQLLFERSREQFISELLILSFRAEPRDVANVGKYLLK